MSTTDTPAAFEAWHKRNFGWLHDELWYDEHGHSHNIVDERRNAWQAATEAAKATGPTMRKCRACGGSGDSECGADTCAACNGAGEVLKATGAAGELPPLPDPLEINWPELNSNALGCGVEDRGIRDRYEAAEYGWQNGVDKAIECVPEVIYDADEMRAYGQQCVEAAQTHSPGERADIGKRLRRVAKAAGYAPDGTDEFYYAAAFSLLGRIADELERAARQPASVTVKTWQERKASEGAMQNPGYKMWGERFFMVEEIAELRAALIAITVPVALSDKQIMAIWDEANTPSEENDFTTGPLLFARTILKAATNRSQP